MISIEHAQHSTKIVGKFEKTIVDGLVKHFHLLGYQVMPHARLNIAWGSILSDLDVLLVKDDVVTVVEVKSHRDKISRGRSQILAISDYIDYGYVATDRTPKVWDDPMVGLLHVSAEGVRCVKEASRFTGKPKMRSLLALKRDVLLDLTGTGRHSNVLKYDLAEQVNLIGSAASLRQVLKEAAFNGS